MDKEQKWERIDRSIYDGKKHVATCETVELAKQIVADHLADRAELVRLLKEYRKSHRHGGGHSHYCEDNFGTTLPDHRCETCKKVDDALEGA